VSGDGDALSIGGNHLIHALRRNVNVKILMFNNQIYGLTKGQYSPTSPLGTVNKTTPMGSVDYPFNPVALALGAEATFVARSIDTDRAHLTETLRRAHAHPGAAFVEIYQNCNVYNDGAFDAVRDQKENRILLLHGEPVRFGGADADAGQAGASGERGVRMRPDGSAEIVDGVATDELLVHDEHAETTSLANALARLSHTPHGPTPIGVFRDVERPVYDRLLDEQLERARQEQGEGDLGELLHAGDTWTIG
jgi:2-oxoglutarate ferredoxin oxidoreductase subunit beta